MALRQLAGKALWAGLATGATAAGAAYCEVDKYFDPEALERGAKALREINTSPHAKRVRCSRMDVFPSGSGRSRCHHLPNMSPHASSKSL